MRHQPFAGGPSLTDRVGHLDSLAPKPSRCRRGGDRVKCQVASLAQAQRPVLTLLLVFSSQIPGQFEFAAKPPNWTLEIILEFGNGVPGLIRSRIFIRKA
jgi:hypothetical protein